MNIHFISGLPRSGSTLFCSILRQNPRFNAGPTSPLANIFLRALEQMNRPDPVNVYYTAERKERMLRGLFDSYYRPGSLQVVYDKNRQWCSQLALLARLFPSCKVISMVRSPAWIMDSIERILRANPFDLSAMLHYEAGSTVYGRCERLARSGGMVGTAFDGLREAYHSEQAHRLLLIEYEALAKQPQNTMRCVYEFLEEKWFEHDFDNVSFSEAEFDLALATPGLHTVRRKVEWRPRETILPPDLFKRFAADTFWRDNALNTRDVSVLLGPCHGDKN